MTQSEKESYCLFIERHKLANTESYQLLQTEKIQKTTIEQFLDSNLFNQLVEMENDLAFNGKIRQIRNALMMKIALEDLNAKEPINHLEKIMHQTSQVARFLIDVCYQRAFDCTAKIYGTPKDENGNEQLLLILALGKLGANELNFSSDVDLIFCYPKEGETDGIEGKRKISNFEFFSKVGQRLINSLNQQLKDGFVYRVDMRLRPFGKSGPLVSPFTALENYYQTHGRDWERYALIKASHIRSNNPKTKAIQEEMSKKLSQILKPFIYRRYLDFSVFESLRDMKSLINAESKSARMKNHIKLGYGGIRLIEFIAQSFQLIYGGRFKRLQINQLQTTISYLKTANLINEDKANELLNAYQFLRVVENRLQQRNDSQTHEIFSDEAQILLLSQSLNYCHQDDFFRDLDCHRQKVQDYFDRLFKSQGSEQSDDWREIWLAAKDKEVLEQQIEAKSKQQFLFLSDAINQSRLLMSGKSISTKLSKNLRTFMALFLEVLEYYYHKHLNLNADLALEQQNTLKVFNRVMQLIKRTTVSNVYLVMFSENRDLIKRICRTARASAMLIDLLAKNPFLIDQLLDRERLYQRYSREKVMAKITRKYHGDLNDEMETLRIFNHQRVLSVAMLDVMKSLPLAEVSNQLSYVTEGILKRVMYCAWLDVAPKFKDLNLKVGEDFLVVALGKFGGLEMSYNSDLDLIFLCRDEKNQIFFKRLVQRMVHMLEIYTNTGKLFTIDLRLRPNGASGDLVNPITVWFEYEKKQAWVWEHQILCRSRVVAGDGELSDIFHYFKKQILCSKRDENELRDEIKAMREKMKANLDLSNTNQFDLKQGKGGIIDIEFLVQFLLLNHAHHHPDLIQYSDNLRQIEKLIDCNILRKKLGNRLIECYFLMRSKIHQLVLENQPALIEPDKVAKEREFVKKLWDKFLG